MIISAIKFLAKRSDALSDSSVICTKNNSKFVCVIEMFAKFGTIIIEHVNRIQNIMHTLIT